VGAPPGKGAAKACEGGAAGRQASAKSRQAGPAGLSPRPTIGAGLWDCAVELGCGADHWSRPLEPICGADHWGRPL